MTYKTGCFLVSIYCLLFWGEQVPVPSGYELSLGEPFPSLLYRADELLCILQCLAEAASIYKCLILPPHGVGSLFSVLSSTWAHAGLPEWYLAFSQVSKFFTFVLATLQSIPYPIVKNFLLKYQVRSFYQPKVFQWLPFSLRVFTLACKALHDLIAGHLSSHYYSPCTLLLTHWPLCCSLNSKSMPPLKSLLTYISFSLECYSPS